MKPNVRDFPQFRDPAENFAVVLPERTEPSPLYRSRFITFEGIGNGHRGVFISGERPFWAFSVRETLRFFPMATEGHVNAFAPFHNSSNEHGFVYHCVSEVPSCSSSPLLHFEFKSIHCIGQGQNCHASQRCPFRALFDHSTYSLGAHDSLNCF